MTFLEFKKGKVPFFIRIYRKRKGTIDIIIGLFLLFILCINLLSILTYHKESQMSPYSDAFHGMSSFREELEAFDVNISVIYSTLDVLESVENPSGSIIILSGVEKDMTRSESASVKGFVENGGTLILADDTGRFANEIFEEMFDEPGFLERLDFYDFFDYTYRFNSALVRDVDYDQSPDFVMEKAIFMDREYKLTFNAPASLDILDRDSKDVIQYKPGTISDFEVFCETTDFAWRDSNSNYKRDPEEMNGFMPLIISQSYHSGQVVMISDPGLFINEMWNRSDNRRFVLDLMNASLNKEKGFVFFDNSKHFQDSFIKNSGQSLLAKSVFATSGRLTYFFWIILVIILIFVLIKVVPLLRYRHITLVNYPWLGRFRSPFVNYADYMWMRSVFLEKVRILSGAHKDKFYVLSREELEALIYDPVLIHFLFDSAAPPPQFRKQKKNYYEEVASRMGRWRPRGEA
jgi:hypothetical protein